MLSERETRRAIGGGVLALMLVLAFVGIAVLALLLWDAGTSGSRLMTAYTWRILSFTIWQAFLSTLLSVGLALPVALALARRPSFPGRIWIIRLMAVPMGLPVLIGALGLIGIWGRQGIANQTLIALGATQPVSIYGLSGILIAHVFFNLPLATRLLLASLERLPAEYWLIASGLGMKPLSIFRLIEWPALRRVVPGIAGLVYMLCATSFTLVLVLGGGPAATTLEVAIYQSLHFDFDPPRAIALAFLQIGVTAILLALISAFPAPEAWGLTAGRPPRRFDGAGPAAKAWDALVIAIAAVFLILPLASIAIAGLRADLVRLATSDVFLKAASTSLGVAFASGLLALGLAILIINARRAIAQATPSGRGLKALSAALAGLSSLVLLIPPVVLGTGWFLALRPIGDVSRFAPMLVALVNALMALPFVTRVLGPAVEAHRLRTDRLSASLGLAGFSRIRHIDLPVLIRPMLMALSFAMALSLGDLGAVALFGSSDFTTLPWLVYNRLASYRSNDADGLALILGVICLALTMIGTAGREKDKRNA